MTEGMLPPGIAIRPEGAGDSATIFEVTERAFRDHPFSEHTEQFIIDALRRNGALAISLVAVRADGVGPRIVGHIAFSPATFSHGSPRWYVLGPIAVLPSLQKRGIGQALVRAGLEALQECDADGCVLLGEPDFYRRFGFRHFPELLLDGVPQELQRYFQALPFGERPPAGTVSCHPAFAATA